MTPKSSSSPRSPRGGNRDDDRYEPSFEALLEYVLAEVASGAATDEAIRSALERIAGFFAVDRVVVQLTGSGGARSDDGCPDAGSVLEIVLGESEPEPLGTAALLASEPGRIWSRLERNRLRLVAGIILNVLRLRSVQDELRENQVWLFMALESAAIGTWDWDVTADRVRYIAPFNPAGGEPEVRETVGVNWFEVTHPQDIPGARAQVERAISGETEAFSFIVRSKRPPYRSGEWFQIASRGTVIARDATGRATRIMGVHEDVTEAVGKAELERERETALAHAAKIASLGALASSLAHEINQPLAALTSFLEASVRLLAKGDAHRAEVMDALQRSVDLAERASEIVRRLRRLLRRERPLQEPVELPGTLRSVRDQVSREARAAGVQVCVADAGEPIVLLGDRVQIEQALVNLVRNAIEALAASDQEAKVVTLEGLERGDLVEIQVRDNGPGMSTTVSERLFEPFFTTKDTGTGLGLVICESIAEIHGGRVRLERTGPAGTTFVLELPHHAEERP